MQKDLPKPGETVAVIKTNQGVMKFRLFPELIAEGVKNFTELAKAGKYKGAPFHRVIRDFMIQGGDFTDKNGAGGHSYKGPGTTIGDQYRPDLTHIRGALAYAKTNAPNSIGSQFYIVHPEKGAHFLDHPAGGGPDQGYTVFGQLYEGFEVLDKIAAAKTKPGDSPVELQVIENVTIESF
ncbi:MAG: peptidylprolyl isomerase [Candidatus Edwardsbacteria bacterium]|nr:peptidylprolyl isomerase [Candidatus Edwardsbacteria bacterium]